MFASPLSSRDQSIAGALLLPAPPSRGMDLPPSRGMDGLPQNYSRGGGDVAYSEAAFLPPQGTFYPATEEGDPEPAALDPELQGDAWPAGYAVGSEDLAINAARFASNAGPGPDSFAPREDAPFRDASSRRGFLDEDASYFGGAARGQIGMRSFDPPSRVDDRGLSEDAYNNSSGPSPRPESDVEQPDPSVIGGVGPIDDSAAAAIGRPRLGTDEAEGSSHVDVPDKASKSQYSQDSFQALNGSRMQKLSSSFPCCCIHCPMSFAVCMTLFILGMSGALYNGIEVESDFSTFLEADSESNDVRQAFSAALNSRNENSRRLQEIIGDASSDNDPLQAEINERRAALVVDRNLLHSILDFNIIYEPVGGDPMDPWFLRDAAAFEKTLREGPKWQYICKELVAPGLIELCDPGVSLPNILFASIMRDPNATVETHVAETKYYAGGEASRPLPGSDKILRLVTDGMRDVEGLIFEEDTANNVEASPRLIRSFFEFNLACCSIRASYSLRSQRIAELKDEYKDFIATELYPKLLDQKEAGGSFNIYWYGSEIDEFEVWTALMQDAKWAIGSVVFIMAYLTLHTWSPLLSFCSMFLAILAIPVAFVTSSRLSGANRVTGASMLSLFLIVGLGADVILVFISFWDLSKQKFDLEDYPGRIKYVYQTAGLSCLATSMTTAASFFANLASVLRPLREFGFFMGWCIMWAYVFIAIGMPALMYINERIAKCCCRCIPEDIHIPARHSRHSMISGESTATKQPGAVSEVVGTLVDRLLRPTRYILLAGFVLTPIIMAIWVSAEAQVAGDLPEMFPEEHNQNKGKEMRENFQVVEAPLPEFEFSFCHFGHKPASPATRHIQQRCLLNWCQLAAEPEDVVGENTEEGVSSCQCHPTTEPPEERRCTVVTSDMVNNNEEVDLFVDARFIGRNTSIPQAFWSSMTWTNFAITSAQKVNGNHSTLYDFLRVGRLDGYWAELDPLIQEHWYSGDLRKERIWEAPITVLKVKPKRVGPICDASQVCYCGAPMCSFWEDSSRPPELQSGDWQTITVPTDPQNVVRRLDGEPRFDQANLMQPWHHLHKGASRPGGSSRRLGEGYVDVAIVWGISVLQSSPFLGSHDPDDIWAFDGSFNPASPHSQRYMLKLCNEVRANRELLIVDTFCWISDFESWLTRRGELFPAREEVFHSQVRSFASSSILQNGARAEDYMWFDSSRRVIAAYVQFNVNMGYSSTSSAFALEQKALWDGVIADYSDGAPMDAPSCFHTSRLWGRAEAEEAIVSSTIETLMIALTCGFIGTVIFTRGNAVLSLFVVVAVSCVTTCLAFFMVVMMSWAIGAIEVLGLIVFAGYSITYSLHVVHKYDYNMDNNNRSHRDIETRRFLAVRAALQSMAGAVVGSAITTLGSSVFLFACTLQIFVKLAAVLFAVTFFACTYAVVAIPAALLVMGPAGCCGIDCFLAMARRNEPKKPYFEDETISREAPEEDVGPESRRNSTSPSSIGARSEVFMAPSRIEVCMGKVQPSPGPPRTSAAPQPSPSPSIQQAVALAAAPQGQVGTSSEDHESFLHMHSGQHARTVASAPVSTRRSAPSATPQSGHLLPAIPRKSVQKVTLPE
mmetsp:Transcript_72469/g.172757  ORF Transcript_72469/g.172757 Transcript_72469/m.172757 type:complete len:1597 (+) Transcript_72469:105-4895(+)